MTEISELFWNATLDEIKRGYVYNEQNEEFTCLICGQSFVKGVIYPEDDVLYEAEKYTRLHIGSAHTSVFDHLMNLGKKMTGLTDHQRVLLDYFQKGYSDNDIVSELGGSASTIRNHRFTLREKEKQAKVFLALMELVDLKAPKKPVETQLSKERKMELKNTYKQTPRPAGVYQVKNKANGKVFVGSTKNLDGMFNRIRFEFKMGMHRIRDLQQDWNEYGAENFSLEVLEQVKPHDVSHDVTEELEALERKWLDTLQPYGERGYNRK